MVQTCRNAGEMRHRVTPRVKWNPRDRFNVATYSRFGIDVDGYMLHSGRPLRLWFSRLVDIRMEDVCQGHGIDHHGLLSEPVEELSAAL